MRRLRKTRLLVILLAVIAASFAARPAKRAGDPTAAEQAALERISADSLRINLSFLASKELEGRATPSPGLDRAAEYIAEQFRNAGLEPAAEGSYFQVAKFDNAKPDLTGFRLLLNSGDKQIEIPAGESRPHALQPLDYTDAPVVVLPASGFIPPVAGTIVAGTLERYGDEALLEELQSRKPKLILLIGKSGRSRPAGDFLDDLALHHPPVIRIRNSAALEFLQHNRGFTMSLHLASPEVKEVSLRNVVALLPGSDPSLRDQYLLLTAHYDHLGRGPRGIYYGANDNASGTASVIEIGKALASLRPHPRRSILFMTFFGEEEGLLGSYYYAHTPLFPLSKTVADINLEQMGRTDEQSGPRLLSFAITGPSYSDLPAIVSAGAKTAGIGVWPLPDADGYFPRSDNYAFALRGMVAHTIAVAAQYPDYHGLGDTPDKIDYANMARVDRGVAAGVLRVADDPDPPHWSDAKAAAVYRAAGEK